MKKIIAFTGLLFLLVLIVFVGFLATFDVNQYKGQIIKVVQEKTGREFDIAGDLGLGVSLIPTITVEGVTLGNASWSTQAEMLKVGTFEAQVALLPLLNKNIEIKRLILNDATILLEKNKQGDANWEMTVKEAKPEQMTEKTVGQEKVPGLAVDEVSINNATLTYIDATSGKTEKVVIDTFSVEAGSFNSPMDIILDAAYNDIPVSLQGTGGSLANLIDNDAFPVDITASIGRIEAGIRGNIENPKEAKGIALDLNLAMDNLQDLAVLAKKELPDAGPVDIKASIATKDGAYLLNSLMASIDSLVLKASGKITDASNIKGITLNFDVTVPNLTDLNQLAGRELPDMGPFSMKGTATDQDSGYQVNGLELNLAQTNLAGSAGINMSNSPPALNADLTSTLIDLTPFMPEEGEAKKKEKKDKVFPDSALPFEKLESVNASVAISADRIATPKYDLTKTTLKLKLNNGNLAISQLDAGILGGQLDSSLSLNKNGNKGVLDIDIKLSGIQPDKLPDMKDKISGAATDITITGKGSGESVAAIMAGLNGHLLIQSGKGKLSDKAMNAASADVVMKALSLLKPGEKNDGSVLECAVVNFKVKDGMATADKGIAMLTQQLNILGSGSINLKTEELDIGVTPKAREGLGINLGQLAELVRLGGTLANPKAKTDTKAALKTGLSAGAAVATGGLSLLAQGLFDRAGSSTNPCDVALGKTTSKQESTSATTETKAQEKSAVESTTDKVKESAGAIGDKLKGLFD